MKLSTSLVFTLFISPVLTVNTRIPWLFFVDIHYYYRTEVPEATLPYHRFMCSGVIWNGQNILTSYECMSQFKYDWTAKRWDNGRLLRSAYVYFGQPEVPETGWNSYDVYSHRHMYMVNMDIPHPVGNNSKLSLLTLYQPIQLVKFSDRLSCLCGPVSLSAVNLGNCIVVGWNPFEENSLPTATCGIRAKAIPCAGQCPEGEFEVKYLEDTSYCSRTAAALVCSLTVLRNEDSWSLVGIASRSNDPKKFFQVKLMEAEIEKKAGENPTPQTVTPPPPPFESAPTVVPSASSSLQVDSLPLILILSTLFTVHFL